VKVIESVMTAIVTKMTDTIAIITAPITTVMNLTLKREEITMTRREAAIEDIVMTADQDIVDTGITERRIGVEMIIEREDTEMRSLGGRIVTEKREEDVKRIEKRGVKRAVAAAVVVALAVLKVDPRVRLKGLK